MASQLRVDHFPKNGKTSPNPKVPTITGRENPRTGAGKDIKTQFNSKPALATANKAGQGMTMPKFGVAPGAKETYAKGSTKQTRSGPPSALHPQSHAAFHALGAPKGGKY